jgi:hypothetical protein
MQYAVLQDSRVVLPEEPGPVTHRHYDGIDLPGWDGGPAILMLMVQVRRPCVLLITFNHWPAVESEFREPSGASASWHEVIDRQWIRSSGNEIHIEMGLLPNQNDVGDLRFSDVVLMWRTV